MDCAAAGELVERESMMVLTNELAERIVQRIEQRALFRVGDNLKFQRDAALKIVLDELAAPDREEIRKAVCDLLHEYGPDGHVDGNEEITDYIVSLLQWTKEYMAWTQTDIDALQAAIAAGRGARTITFADQSITFHSVSEMLALLAAMQQAVSAEAAAATGGSRTRFAATSKGLR
jgi:hypothetical protein